MDDKDKQDLEKILSRSRQMQAAEINQRKKDKVNFKKDLLEINNENKKEKEALTKSSTNKTSLKCNLL